MRQFVVSLKSACKINVRMGANYEEILPGSIYVSPGDKHMQVTVKNNKPYIRTFEGEPVNFCRPSVDVLFYSTARIFKDKALGVLLTGMGRDGVAGLRAIKSEGGKTIAESAETSILYGMPKVAAETGAADFVLPNYKIIDEIINFMN
jgi:two-component system chemotaxis response regulator CheB